MSVCVFAPTRTEVTIICSSFTFHSLLYFQCLYFLSFQRLPFLKLYVKAPLQQNVLSNKKKGWRYV